MSMMLLEMWECDRLFGDVGGAIAFGNVGVRSPFGMWGCDRLLGCGGAIAFWDDGMRSLLGIWAM
jgi:hypothetical protein